MSTADPHTIGITRDSRIAERISSAHRQIGALNRRGGGGHSAPGGTPGAGSITGEVIGPVPGVVTINTAATPRVQRLGIGVAASTGTTTLTLQSTAMTDLIIDDTAHGEHVTYGAGAVGSPGSRWNIQHGTDAAPVTTAAPTLKVSRKEEQSGWDFTTGGAFWDFCAIVGFCEGTVDSTAQTVGGTFYGSNYSDRWTPGSPELGNSDCVGVAGLATIYEGGHGVGMGAHFEAGNRSASGTCKGIEIQSRPKPPDALTTYNTGGLSRSCGIWILCADTAGGGGIEFGNPAACQWDYGISFKNQGTSPCSIASIVDHSAVPTSILLNGSYSTAAIAISGGNRLLVGATSSSLTSEGLFRASGNARNALCVMRNSSSSSVDVFTALTDAGASMFGIGPGGNVRLDTGVMAIQATASSTTGLLIDGSSAFTTAGLAIASTGGRLLVGMTSTAGSCKAHIKTTAAGDSALILQAAASQTQQVFHVLDSSGTGMFAVAANSNLQTWGNIAIQNSGGMKIATATTQKIGFFNQTPIAQQTALTARSATALSTGGAAVLSTSDQGVIDNIRTRLNELESRMNSNATTGLGLIAGTA
jgi:hypothetical protein